MNWWETLHLISTVFMVGVIWYVQLVHYPMFDDTTRPVLAKFITASDINNIRGWSGDVAGSCLRLFDF